MKDKTVVRSLSDLGILFGRKPPDSRNETTSRARGWSQRLSKGKGIKPNDPADITPARPIIKQRCRGAR